MSELNPEDKALLELAREAHEPTDGDRRRVRRALFVQLGVGTGLVGTTAATSKAATAVAVTKVLAAVAIAGAIGGTSAAVYRAAKSGRAAVRLEAPRSAPPAEPRAAPVPPAPAPANLPEPSPIEPAAEALDRHPVALTNAPRANNVTASRPALPPSSQDTTAATANPPGPGLQETPSAPDQRSMTNPMPLPPTTLEAETRLIRAGIAALHAGDAARALALFDEHARAFPDGALAEERAAERVIALGALHRCDQARAAAAGFLLDHPHSPLAARVREPCGHASNP